MAHQPLSQSIKAVSGWTLSAALLLSLVGCADVITYSQDSQREGLKLYKEGDYADAAGAFRNSTRQNPRNYQGYYYLGASYEQMGQYQQAIAAYRASWQTSTRTLEGREDSATRAKVLDGLASAISKTDDLDVETNAVQHEAQTSQTGENWFLLAKIYALRGDPDSAIDAYNRAALLEPQNFLINKEYGLYLEKVGQPQKAETALRRAYALNNQDEAVNLALRRVGVVPGPSIRDESQLAKPLIPKGPIPQVHLGSGSPQGGGTVEAPRD